MNRAVLKVPGENGDIYGHASSHVSYFLFLPAGNNRDRPGESGDSDAAGALGRRLLHLHKRQHDQVSLTLFHFTILTRKNTM